MPSVNLKSRESLDKSRLLWLRKEKYRYARWRTYVRTKPKGHPSREKWHTLYVEAVKARRRRENQLSKLRVNTLDTAGVDFIVGKEGNLPYVYNDSQGHATVGVGHLLHLGNYTAADARKWGTRSNPKHTKAEFLTFFRKDAIKYENAVRGVWKRAKSGPTQNQFNADTSLCFNIGTGGFSTSSHARLIIAGAAKSVAAKAILLWNKPPEIMGRRRSEYDLYLR